MQHLKSISYRGGLITFRIPAQWKEEYAADGGGSFYEDAPNTPTFRLEVITAQAPGPLSVEASARVLAPLGEIQSGTIESLDNGNAVLRYTQSTTEQGQPLHISYWSLAQVIPPNHARIATFSHTLLEGQQTEAQYAAEIELLDREVRAAKFWPSLSTLSQAEAASTKQPWWRFW